MGTPEGRDGSWRWNSSGIPADVVAVLALLAVGISASLFPPVRGTTLAFALSLPILAFLPGYAIVGALYPGTGGPEAADADDAGRFTTGIDGYERLTLSIGISLAVVPMIGYVSLFPIGRLRLWPVLLGTSLVTVGGCVVTVWRRRRLSAQDRFRVPYRQWLARGRSVVRADDRVDLALNVALAGSLLLAAGTFAYTTTAPKPTDAHTELYLLTENESGDLVASGYPTDLVRGEPAEFIVGVTNQEHADRSYSIVAVLQRVRVTNESITVRESRDLRRFSTELAHAEQWVQRHTITPTMTGERLRLGYLLYEGAAPPEPSFENADDQVFLWINVTSGAE